MKTRARPRADPVNPGDVCPEMPRTADAERLSRHLLLFRGAAATGALVSGRRALLFDACDSVTPERLAGAGIRAVDWILITQARRPNISGVPPLVARGARLAAPEAERIWLEHPEAAWTPWDRRWHRYDFGPGLLAPLEPLAVSRAVREGDRIAWEGFQIQVIETPGAAPGGVSYLLEVDGRRVIFVGGLLYDAGRVDDFWSLQEGFRGLQDYHGFLGRWPALRKSLRKVATLGAEWMVTSHGGVVRNPAAACARTIANLQAVWRHYIFATEANDHFPEIFSAAAPGWPRLRRLASCSHPRFVWNPGGTSRLLVSESGAGFLIDAGSSLPIETILAWMKKGRWSRVEGLWLTHYHDDHVDAADLAHRALRCPVIVEEHMADLLRYPRRYGLLPCQSPTPVPVTEVRRHGESWRWREFTLTAFHFPGQTFYHAGLLVEGHGTRVFFAGDSFGPAGFDDYCPANRLAAGPGRGFDACLDVLEAAKPDRIYNQHLAAPFRMTAQDIGRLRAALRERDVLWRRVLPWEDISFGVDEHWISVYPYEQDVGRGGTIPVSVRAMNYGAAGARLRVQAVPPTAWAARAGKAVAARVPAGAEGAAIFRLTVPERVSPGVHRIPIRISWNGRYLGPYRHAVLHVF